MENKETVQESHKVEHVQERKQKVSATYTLRACGENARKLLDMELITEKEYEVITGIQKKAIEKYIKAEMGI